MKIGSRFWLRCTVYGLIYTSFILGLPAFHYVTALMIVIILRHKDSAAGLLTPVASFRLW